MRALAYDPEDQKTRRQRARITQQDIAGRLGISDSAVSDYEAGEGQLSVRYGLTGEDYEKALLDAIQDKRTAEGNRK